VSSQRLGASIRKPTWPDLASTPAAGLQVQLCGDAHLSNLGAFASPERKLVFDVNDFDETLPGPFEWDVKRLAASFSVAARPRRGHQNLIPEGAACQRDPIALMSVVRRLRIDDVGCLPQRAGYPVPQPQLLKLLNQIGEQLAQWRQVKHAWLAVAIYYPPGLRGVGRAARLVGDVADDGVGKARSIGKADLVAAQVDVRAGRWIGGDRWRWILRHRNHPSSGRSAGLTCIASRNASCPAPIFTAITSHSRSRLSWPTHRHAGDGPG
jgi:hypothetical protein